MRTQDDLRYLQSLPLSLKIAMTKTRIREWVSYYGTSGVYVSFSGGKDSTVLKHIVDSMYDGIPALFVNTGLEYPEIQAFVKEVKAGKYECFCSNVDIVRPAMRFDEVIKKHGYPLISKSAAHAIKIAKRHPNGKVAKKQFDPQAKGRFAFFKWKPLVELSDIFIGEDCCKVMKKTPAKQYGKETGRVPFIGTMAEESSLRFIKWLKNGCNAFSDSSPSSQPLSFWTNQDILHYIKEYNVPYCPVYGEIVPTSDEEQVDGQLTTFELLGDFEGTELKTTGCDRTGCIFCVFGCHLDKSPNRFEMLKKTHPKQYAYCINGGEYDETGKWQPNKEGLGMGHVFDELNKIYGDDFIKY